MIFVPPSFFQGRRLRPCFNGVDAPVCRQLFNQIDISRRHFFVYKAVLPDAAVAVSYSPGAMEIVMLRIIFGVVLLLLDRPYGVTGGLIKCS